MMHETEHRDNAVAIGELWRAHLQEVIALQANDGALLHKRLSRGEFPLQDVDYRCQKEDNDRKCNGSMTKTFKECAEHVAADFKTMGSERHDNMCKLWGHLLAFMEVGARRYGAEFLPGGAFSEENLAAHPEMKFILQTVSANAMLVESGFGAIDKS